MTMNGKASSGATLSVEDLKKRLSDPPNSLDLSMSSLTHDTVPTDSMARLGKRVTSLDLSTNNFYSLPENLFTALSHLTHLNLSNNKMTKLPVSIGELTGLVKLDLYRNSLVILPHSFGRLNNLQWLDLRANPLNAQLGKIAGACLDETQCRQCAKNIIQFMSYVHQEELKRQAAEQDRLIRNQQQNAETDSYSTRHVKQRKKKPKNKSEVGNDTNSDEDSSGDKNGMSGDHLKGSSPTSVKPRESKTMWCVWALSLSVILFTLIIYLYYAYILKEIPPLFTYLPSNGPWIKSTK